MLFAATCIPSAQLEIEQNFVGTKPHTAKFSSLNTIFSHWHPLQAIFLYDAPSHSQRHRITTIIIQFYLLFLLLLFDFVHKSSFARRHYATPASPATDSKKHSILMHKTTSRFLFGVASVAVSVGWFVWKGVLEAMDRKSTREHQNIQRVIIIIIIFFSKETTLKS